MKCEELRPSVGAYVDGELDARERRTVRRHLARCPDCSLHYEELKTLGERLRSLKSTNLEADEDFTEELLEQGRTELDADRAGDPVEETDSYARTTTRVLGTVMLMVGLFLGGFLGLQFSTVLEASRTVRVPSSAPVAESPPEDVPNPATESPADFTNAYFELATAESPGGNP